MKPYLKSNPTFFRLILAAMGLCTLLLLILAAVIPAPLQQQGTIAIVPNPVKSAWFLLWIQELVSYDKRLIYAVGAIALAFGLLPWLTCQRIELAGWLRRGNRAISILSLAVVIMIGLLTIIAMYFRGPNWSFMLPF